MSLRSLLSKFRASNGTHGHKEVLHVGVSTTSCPTLLWEEKFGLDGSKGLDEASWSFHTGDGSEYGIPGWGNSELQHYTSENVRIDGGILRLTASFNDGQYYSAKIHSKGKKDFHAGQSANGIRIEASIQLPQGGQGIWPAFWMLPSEGSDTRSGEGVYGHWPMSGEIDIMEAINCMATSNSAVHFGGPGHRHCQVSASTAAHMHLDQGYHLYAVEWRQHEMVFFVDGQAFMRTVCSCHKGNKNGWHTTNGLEAEPCSRCAPFDRPFHLILNLAVGGQWPGNPNCFTNFPQTMSVQSIRVWGL